MRTLSVTLFVSVVLVSTTWAADLRNFEDAALHAVHFISTQEGWAVGDEGVVWQTIDGGERWERRPTGVRASLRSVYFLNFSTGWAVGREELPHGAGSVGVILFTRDGGLKWQRVANNSLPGLNCVRFIDNRNGIVAGDGCEQYPTGLFQTSDGGRNWQPVPGPRCTSWLAADFQVEGTGALAGAWNRLATLRDGKVVVENLDSSRGCNLTGLKLTDKNAVAVGQGAMILLGDGATGKSWRAADLKPFLPRKVQACWDFHAVACTGTHVWAAGRPGSAILHSPDRGKTWEVQRTGQPLPLQGLSFIDERRGWAAGEFGTILATRDGGASWQIQRRGGQRAAVLFIHARAPGLPVDTIAMLAGEEGYLATALRVTAADPDSAAPGKSTEAQRWAAAVRLAGGSAGDALWQFPLPQHLVRARREDVLKFWDQLHRSHAEEELMRQMVLAIRIWRPSVIITDNPDVAITGCPCEALVAEAVQQAMQRAADPKAFPEQIENSGWSRGNRPSSTVAGTVPPASISRWRRPSLPAASKPRRATSRSRP